MRSRCIFASFVAILWVASNGPSQAGLVSRWKMDGNADDAIGTRDGTLIDNPSFVNDVPPRTRQGNPLAWTVRRKK